MKQIVEDKSQLILTILAMILASFAIGQNISDNAAREREREDLAEIIDAKIQAGVAAGNADMAAAKQNARLALDRADKLGAALEARGLVKLENH